MMIGIVLGLYGVLIEVSQVAFFRPRRGRM